MQLSHHNRITRAARSAIAGSVVRPLLLGALGVALAALAGAAVLSAGERKAGHKSLRGHAAVLHTPGATMSAVWASRPKTLTEMAGRAQSVVKATVTDITNGPPLVGDEADDVMPTQRITFKIGERWRGSSPREFVLFKTGSATRWIEDDPPYSLGEQYVLFVSRRPGDGTYLPVGPDGRIKVQEGRLRPLIDGPVAATVGGLSVPQARQVTTNPAGR